MHSENVEDRYQAEEMFVYFCRAIAELPVDCRRVFILKKVYGLSQAEIAERFAISVSMVEKHVAKGMAMTGTYMVTQGYWDESELVSSAEAHNDREARKP
jgi:RNA polymerase sigma-70 factor (ECF subfamily)